MYIWTAYVQINLICYSLPLIFLQICMFLSNKKLRVAASFISGIGRGAHLIVLSHDFDVFDEFWMLIRI